MFLDAGKTLVMSEFQKIKTLAPFVTSLTLNFTQNGPKFTTNTIKDDKMIVLI